MGSDEIGELIFRNPVLMKGYYNDPEQTSEVIRNGWIYTGDLVRRDADGFFYFVDRKKDVIRVRGENVASIEVEETLLGHEDVVDAGVVGVSSELGDEDVAAFAVLRAGSSMSREELLDWCRPRMAGFKVPRYVWFEDSLPKTATQRTEKRMLRDRANELLGGEQ